MKIHNNGPISGTTTRKTTRSNANGVFGQLLDAEIHPETPAYADQQHGQNMPSADAKVPMREAWNTLEASVSLLDEAMHCIEAGDSPPQKLIQDIEQLRELLRQQVASGSAALELRQADTLLAVEAERIRAMQS